MKVSHCFNKWKLSVAAPDDCRFLIGNSIGSYFLFSQTHASRYDGLYFMLHGCMIKIIDPVPLQAQEITNLFFSVDTDAASYMMPDGYNALLIEKRTDQKIPIEFDIKESYDSTEFERHYSVSEEEGVMVVQFTKRENGAEKFTVYAAVMCDGIFNRTEQWIKKEYLFDKDRNSNPSERFVFVPFETAARTIVIAASAYRENAVRTCKFVFEQRSELKKKKQKKIARMLPSCKLNTETGLAYAGAIHSLEMLMTKDGLYAGLPWFFQHWSRDTAICLKAFIILGRHETVKKIIFEELSLLHGSQMPAQRGSKLNAADAPLWLAIRICEWISALSKDHAVQRYLSEKELQYLKSKLVHLISGVEQHSSVNGLVHSDSHETWMDSLERKGENIEVQALMLRLYAEMAKLTKDSSYLKKRDELKMHVVQYFWNGFVLLDSLEDPVVRPNAFLGAYLARDILHHKEWKMCFHFLKEKLWNEWGGFATIDKLDERYHPHHTGEQPDSYHNGDSWYYVNNLAAIALYECDKRLYKEVVGKILSASTNDILAQGIISCPSEISSSHQQASKGCLCQAWSAATYIELVHTLFLKKNK